MSTISPLPLDEAARLRAAPAVSWGAIIAGAMVAVSVSLVLVILGAGLGLSSLTPLADRGLSARSLTVAATIWLIVTQWLSAGLGGYIAGRLRPRWLATHGHEVFFRDTAHGLVTWAVATVIVLAMLSGSASVVSAGPPAGVQLDAVAAEAARQSAAAAALYTALSLLIGAFIASVAAAIGGRLRDEHQ
jgi:hypothetical protein